MSDIQNPQGTNEMEQEAAPAPASSSAQLGQSVYQRNRANPFIPSGGAQMWNNNNLILKNEALRKRAGVNRLDQGISNMYATNPASGSN